MRIFEKMTEDSHTEKEKGWLKTANPLIFLARPARLERATLMEIS